MLSSRWSYKKIYADIKLFDDEHFVSIQFSKRFFNAKFQQSGSQSPDTHRHTHRENMQTEV